MSDRPPDTDPEGHTTQDPTVPIDSLATSGSTLEPFLLRERVGAGGMGEVWKAEQTSPVRRTVALKLIKAGMDSREVLARFEAERQALALMDHPCIAKVFDAGTTPQGRPWFAMEYVRGIPITEYCDKHRLSTADRLQLFQRVCEGVQHAHQKAVLHRDLKPGNILVTDVDEKPLPKIIDFGVAKATTQKLTEKTMYTAMGQLIGTPEYMSPEQAELTGEDVDTRTDVYSLGVVLYELLVGALPFDPKELRKAGFEGIVRMLREQDPPRPSTRLSTLGNQTTEIATHRRTGPQRLSSQLKGDLDWIVMRCLEKDRNRRYGSPQELAQDIRRHMEHEPVQAGPPSAGYRARKFVRRNRLGVGIAAATVAVLVAFTTTMAVQSQRIAQERDRANQEAEASERVSAFLADMLSDVNPQRFGNTVYKDLHGRIAQGYEQSGLPDSTAAARLQEFEREVVRVNLADFAREVLDAEILGRAAERIDVDFEPDPLIAARLHHTLGVSYHQLNLLEKAENHLRAAYDIRSERLGEEDPVAIASLQEIIRMRSWVGTGAIADSLNQIVLPILRRTLGSDHPQTLEALAHEASSFHVGLHRQGLDPAADDPVWAQADSSVQEAFAMCRRVLGDEDEHTLSVQYDAVDLHVHLGRHEQALELARHGLETSRRVLGDSHRASLAYMRMFSYLYRQLDRFEEAMAVNQKFVAICESSFGLVDRETRNAMFHLGSLFRKRGSFPAAEATFVRGAEAWDRRYGTERLRSMILELVRLYQQWGRLAEAEQLQREQVEVLRRVRGERDDQTVSQTTQLAAIYTQLGRYDESERLFRELRQFAREEDGPESRRYLTICAGLGNCLAQRGRHEQAEMVYREALEGRRKLLGDLHDETRATLEALARLLARAGREQEARPLWVELIAAWRQVATSPSREKNFLWRPLDGSEQLGPAGERDRFAQILMSGLFEDLRDPEEALNFALEANEISGFTVPHFLDTLAHAYHLTGQSERAGTTQRKALDLIPVEMAERREVYATRLREYETAAQMRTN